MKYLTALLSILAACAFPVLVHADDLTYKEAWVFHYRFTLTDTTGKMTGSYAIDGGDATLPVPGTSRIVIVAQKGDVLSTTPFEPVTGTQTVQVPYEDRVFWAQIIDASGTVQLNIGLAGSRTCDDNGVCDADQGENSDNCPTDCGLSAQAGAPATTTQTAAISTQGGISGGLLLVVADIAVIGLVLLVDRRRRA